MKPISKTAFYTCGIRMLDAERAEPFCGDTYAKVFMNDEGSEILAAFDEAAPNASTVVRHRIIDDLLRDEIAAKPDLSIVIIGAGFDSRAFRVAGGGWTEVDEPQVIEYKNERLPVSETANKLERIAINFGEESLEERLAHLSGHEPVTVVIEGVLMYLEQEAINEMVATLKRLFPRHRLICDLMTRAFFRKYARETHEKVAGMGAAFKFTVDDPKKVFTSRGYKLIETISTVERAVALGAMDIPRLLLKTIFRTLGTGYSVYVFET